MSKEKIPVWLLELRYMANADKPLFAGLMEKENGVPRWHKDSELATFVKNGWATVEAGGFIITQRGRRIVDRNFRSR